MVRRYDDRNRQLRVDAYKIYGEPESPKEKASLIYIYIYKYKLSLRTTSIHVTACRAIQTLKLLNLDLPNSQTVELATRQTFELSISTHFQTFTLCKLSIFRTLKLANFHPFQTFDL